MSDRCIMRERALWIALVSILATSMLWLAAIAVFEAVHFHSADLAPAFTMMRALGHVALLMTPRLLPLLLLAALGAMMLMLAVRRRTLPNRGTTHV